MKEKRPILVWLALVCLMVVLMVVIGGITRLTHSGLSIVEWRPITGVIPPLSDAAWQEMFSKYQQFPEYKLLNHGMELGEFKRIFFWEYLHRLVARLIGFVVLLPWVYFFATRRMAPALARKTAFGFVLGGLQGLMGWLMVKSGLVHDPHVSHYRLAAHLLLAFLVLAYYFWIFLDEIWPPFQAGVKTSSGLRPWVNGLLALLVLQITYGAFTAGLKAGFGYNTFPMMNGEWVPSGFFLLEPALRNFFENPPAVQFVHRTIAWLLMAFLTGLVWRARRLPLGERERSGFLFVLAAFGVQFLLGVATILLVVPVSVATLHQFGAVVLFLSVLFLRHALRSPLRT